jgi:hypothetical protein
MRIAGPQLPPAVGGIADTCEKVADGVVGASQRKSVLRNLAAAFGGDPVGAAAFAYGLIPLGAKLLGRQVVTTARAVSILGPNALHASVTVPSHHSGQADLMRELHGPLIVRPGFDPDWRNETTEGLARAVYEQKAFDRLPILADALEDAGCTDPEILGHCRADGAIHAKGCWVVDLVIGLE